MSRKKRGGKKTLPCHRHSFHPAPLFSDFDFSTWIDPHAWIVRLLFFHLHYIFRFSFSWFFYFFFFYSMVEANSSAPNTRFLLLLPDSAPSAHSA
jgi:hypothetical protein